VLTEEQNKILTQVGRGTPGGELLRRYWHPVCIAKELTPEEPTKFVRILGEDLVLFMDHSGRVGLIADRCPHRGVSLLYGRVEKRGISCAYHGWLMDTEGNVVETPAEQNEHICKNVKTIAYPVQRFMGFYWTYMGPQPAPVLPKFDIFMRKDGRYKILAYPRLDCNWFVSAENGVDSSHLQLLHQVPPFADYKPADSTRGYIDDVESAEYIACDYGILKKRTYHGGVVDQHPLIFPLWLRSRYSIWFRTPIDDEHTNHWVLDFRKTGAAFESDDQIEIEYLEPFKSPAHLRHPEAKFQNLPTRGWPLSEDVVMWETQGAIADRTQEHLGASDKGIAMLRKMMFDNIERVKRGEDPIGVFRDPDQVIDTGFEKSFTMEYPTGHVAKTVPIEGRKKTAPAAE
jgi:5,5'-dehydrodivanillate O-demethylase